jgi:hypothetical protein
MDDVYVLLYSRLFFAIPGRRNGCFKKENTDWGIKKAENTAVDASKHVPMSFAFGNDYAWRALGDATMVEENSAQLHGKILGFGMHFGCGMLVDKCYGLFEKKTV